MTARLTLAAPATLTVLTGSQTLSSLGVTPPGGIAVSGASAGFMTVQIQTGDTEALVTASGIGGATVVNAGNLLTLTGTQTQINAALASLEVIEPPASAPDVLTLIATQPSLVAATTGIAIDIIPTSGPAFVAPGTLVTVQPNMLDSLPFLTLSDPIASGLAAMGLGQEETLNLTLAVSSGVLFLPGYSDASPVSATGLGTGEIILNLTADDIPMLNTLLAGLEFAGPSLAGGEQFQFALRNLSGVLPYSLTRGNIFLDLAGAGGAGTFSAGSQTLIEGAATLSDEIISDTLTVFGSIAGAAGLAISATGNLELPDNALTLGGTSLDFGTISADGLALSGDLVIANTAALQGPVTLGAAALLDFTGFLNAGAALSRTGAPAISLRAGAELTGDGTLLAGNFSASGEISGPGAILARGGETLLIAAGSVGGFTQLDAAPGGVVVLGPVSSLYGIFDTTPLTIDSSVTLNFQGNAGSEPVSGGDAGTLGGDGGAFVISGPQVFSGLVNNFQPGDELIFPGLTGFNILNTSNNTFTVAGTDNAGNTSTYVIRAAIPAGDTPVAGLDAAGDPVVSLRPAAATVSQAALFEASAGVAQPLLGLSLELFAATTQSLTLTLSAAQGVLTDGTQSGASITLTAGGIAALNAALAGLSYTGSGVADSLTIASATGVLAGLSDMFALNAALPGIVNGDGLPAFSEAQLASFSAGPLVFSLPATAGEVQVAGIAEFTGPVRADGITGTALVVDGGGTAIFNAAAAVTLGADATIGDAFGAGTLAILTDAFAGSGMLTLSSASAVYVPGALILGGSLEAGGLFDLTGTLEAEAVSLDAGGTLLAQGSVQTGGLYDSGEIALDGAAQGQGSYALVQGGTLVLGGTSSLALTGVLQILSGAISIGPDAVVEASAAVMYGGTLTVAGQLEAATMFGGAITLAGGTLDIPGIELAATLSGYGVINAATFTADGVLEAQGGELVVGGSLGPGVAPEIAGGAALDLAGGFIGSAIFFAGDDALLTVNDASAFAATPVNFSASDAVDLVGIAPDQVTYSGGTGGNMTVYDPAGNLLTHFGMEIAPGQPGLTVVSDGAGGALITLGDELPCFTRGTGLLTPHGYKPVESLKPGDPLITASGVSRPVRWIGRRTLDLGPRAAWFALPVLIMPGAFGPGLPSRRLRLSPLHCVFADGALFPVTHLVNGATILRDDASAAMTYYHVELDRHDILLAEGLPCESYFDSGNRGGLYQELGRRCPARKPYAPSLTKGPPLARLRRRLHRIAMAAGFSLTYWPSLRAVGGGQGAVPEITRLGRWRMARFSFAAPVREITLLSGVACPADTDPDSQDRRELGVCLEPASGIRLGAGFYPRAAADDGHWMGRVATVHLDTPAAEVTLPLAAIVQSWVRK